MTPLQTQLEEIEKRLAAGTWLIETSGDGQRNSKIVYGSIDDVKKELASEMWYGPYEEAMQDEMVSSYINSLDDENNWTNDVWHEDGEQCWFRVCKIDDGNPDLTRLIKVVKVLMARCEDVAINFQGSFTGVLAKEDIKKAEEIMKGEK